VKQLLREIDGQELSEWMAYFDREPFGEGVAWLRHGLAQAMQANIHRDAKKRTKPFEAADFMLPERRTASDEDGRDLSAAHSIEAMARWMNASMAVDKRDLSRIPRWALEPHERAALDRHGADQQVILTDA
jgi:hypothetical protein